MPPKKDPIDFTRFADILAALGTEPRLRIVYHLLRAHPAGMVAGQIQSALKMQPSAVSHHLEKLKIENLVRVKREGTFLRYTANPDVLQDLLSFLHSQCCAETNSGCQTNLDRFCGCDCASTPARTSTRKGAKRK